MNDELNKDPHLNVVSINIENFYQAGIKNAHDDYTRGNWRFASKSPYSDVDATKWWDRGYRYEVALIKVRSRGSLQSFASLEENL